MIWLRKRKADPILVIQKSAIEKPVNNPCNDLPIGDVAGQDAIQMFQAEFVDPKSPRKSTETKNSTSMLGGGNKTKAKVLGVWKIN